MDDNAQTSLEILVIASILLSLAFIFIVSAKTFGSTAKTNLVSNMKKVLNAT
ncbi:MAG: hypothetical protein QW735_01405 [archaeon]